MSNDTDHNDSADEPTDDTAEDSAADSVENRPDAENDTTSTADEAAGDSTTGEAGEEADTSGGEQEQDGEAAETETTGTAKDATDRGEATSAGSYLERVRNMPVEDWLLVALALIVALPFGYQYAASEGHLDGLPWVGDGSSADPAVVQYCEDTATAVEENASLPRGTSCDCVPPGTFDESRYSVAEKVDEVTELFLVKCTLPSDQNLVFPVRKIVNESINASEQLPNTTVVQ